MARKVRKCIVCGNPTLADNRLCKRRACHETRALERIKPVPDDGRGPPASGTFISLSKCLHGISLLTECYKCNSDWELASTTEDDERTSYPNIKYAIKL